MRSLGYCSRCSQPLDLASEGGLCRSCQIGIDTSRSSPNTLPSSPLVARDTATFPPPDQGKHVATVTGPQPGTLAEPPGRHAPHVCVTDPQGELPPAPPGYELIRTLDSGGMGVVYLARCHTLDRIVAMKFLRGAPSRSAPERFLVEVRALAALDHPNIVRVLGYDFYRADPYFTMEFEPGGTLSDLVKKRGALPPGEAVGFIRAVAGAVQAAHAEGILHRDLKPSNILLGTDGRPKVSDFGLAKRTDKDDGITGPDATLGTPSYMPPEQIAKGRGEVGPASDVYGLGATLYHLLTGRVPFRGATHTETMNQVLRDPPKRPRAIRPEIPLALEAVVMKCLEKNPSDRYPTAQALANDLDRLEAGLLPDAPLFTWRRRVAHGLRRNGKRIAAATVAVAVLTLAAIALWPTKPEDDLRRALKSGKPYVVVGETGEPRYYRWRLGGGAFGADPTRENACFFESLRHAMLELVPEDPGTDHYRVTFQLKHLRIGPGKPEALAHPFVRFYWGHAEQVTPDGLPVQTLLALDFSDDKPDFGPNNTLHAFTCWSVVLLLQPHGDPTVRAHGIGTPSVFRKAGEGAERWHSFRIDVTPNRVRIEWMNPQTGQYQRLGEWTGVELQKDYAKIQDMLPPGAVVPVWSPRMPMGVMSKSARLLVRNFVIAPLNPERE